MTKGISYDRMKLMAAIQTKKLFLIVFEANIHYLNTQAILYISSHQLIVESLKYIGLCHKL